MCFQEPEKGGRELAGDIFKWLLLISNLFHPCSTPTTSLLALKVAAGSRSEAVHTISSHFDSRASQNVAKLSVHWPNLLCKP